MLLYYVKRCDLIANGLLLMLCCLWICILHLSKSPLMVFRRTSPESPRFRALKSTQTKTVFIVDISVFQKYFKSTNDRFMRSTERTEQHSFRARSIPPKISNHLHHNLIKHIMSLPDSNKLINEVQLPI